MSLLEEVAALESELHHPGGSWTRERLEQLLHPAFFEVGRSGVSYQRAQVIEFLLGHQKPTALSAEDYRLTSLSADTALLTYRSTHAEAAGTSDALRSSIWQKTGAAWQLVYHQGTAAP